MQTVHPAAVDAPSADSGSGLGRSGLSDELLARHAARGRARAFEAIYQRYYQPLYQYCHSILRHEADAQDALQSTFAKALVALQKDQRKAPLRPWLYRIAHNEAISVIRSRRRDQPAEPSEMELGTAMSAEDEVGARERWSTLVADLGELGDNQRSALLLRELNGLSHEEIGITLETTTAGAKQFIFEARQALAEFAEGREMACEDVRRRISDGDRRVLRGRKVRSHLRGCAGCAAFAVAIPTRQTELRAMAPVLAPVMAAELFSRALGTAASHGAAGASAAASAAPSAIGAAGTVGKIAGGSAIWKAVAGAVIVAGAAVGVAKLHHTHHHHAPASPGTSVHRVGGGSAGSGSGPGSGSGSGGGHHRAATGHGAKHAGARKAGHGGRVAHSRGVSSAKRRAGATRPHGRPLFGGGSSVPVVPPSLRSHHGGSTGNSNGHSNGNANGNSNGHSNGNSNGHSNGNSNGHSNGQHRGSGGSGSSSTHRSTGSGTHKGSSGGNGSTSDDKSNSATTKHRQGSSTSSHTTASRTTTSTPSRTKTKTASTTQRTATRTHHSSTNSQVTSTLSVTTSSTTTETHGNKH